MLTIELKTANRFRKVKWETKITMIMSFFILIISFDLEANLISIRVLNHDVVGASIEVRENASVKTNFLLWSISGKVINEQYEPVAGVNVLVKGTTIGAVTDGEGKYVIDVPDGEKMVLVFSSVGFKSQEIDIRNRRVIDITLLKGEATLDDVVVVGYGTQSRATITTSVSKLDDRALKNIPYSNATSALQGSVSGVRVQSISGQPGAAPRVIVRGGTSIDNPNGATPLYIIDGVIRSDMNHISTENIESIQVLKDAAATSIYGARGSNGVIIVVTKSGKAGSTVIDYNYGLTTSNVARTFDIASARDQVYYHRLARANSAMKNPSQLDALTLADPGGTGNDLTNNTGYNSMYLTDENRHKLDEGWESMLDPIDPSKTIIFKGTDWQKKLFRTGLSHNHYLSASGGTEKATFDAGVGYNSTEGIAITTFYKRLSAHINGELKINDKLKTFARVNFSHAIDNGISFWAFGRVGAAINPLSKYKFEDGTMAPGGYFGENIEYYQDRQAQHNEEDNLTFVLGSKWDILPGLSFEPQVSLFNVMNDGSYFLKSYLAVPGVLNTSRYTSGFHSNQSQKQADAVFSYSKSFGLSHNVAAKAGFSYFEKGSKYLSAEGMDAASDLVPTLNASATPSSVYSSESQFRVAGYFAGINYDFNQKYLLTLNGRYDGASNLGANRKWGFFPGISVGWNLHKENFWSSMPLKILSQLKVRGSYGVNGNIAGLGDYAAQGQYSVGSKYGGIAGIVNTALANQDLRWERSKTFNLGLDIGIFDNRVSILFDRFRRVTDNLLTNLSLPHETGFGSILTNLGSLENKGIEVELRARLFPEKSAFQWDVGLNASKVDNKILKLPYNGAENNRIGGISIWNSKTKSYTWVGGLQEGGRPGDLFAYKQLSIYSTDEEAAAGPVDMIIPGTDKQKFGGDVNWLDADNNGVIDGLDRIYVGNIYPKWTGGITNNFSYKGFDLLVRMDYTTGHTSYDETRALLLGQFSSTSAFSTEVSRSWINQGDITDIPRVYWADVTQYSFRRGNSKFYEPGDFLAIREVTLSYMFPNVISGKIHLKNLRLYVTGSNLHYFTNYKGYNPKKEAILTMEDIRCPGICL